MRKLLVVIIFAIPATIVQAAEGSQNLIDLYQAALSNDPTWASARSANTAAQEQLEQGKALYRPTVTFDANASHSESNIKYKGLGSIFGNGGPESFDTSTYGINVNQPIFRLDNFIRYQQSKVRVTLADKQLLLAQQDLMLRVSQAYFDVLLAQDKIELVNAQKSAINRQFEQAKAN